MSEERKSGTENGGTAGRCEVCCDTGRRGFLGQISGALVTAMIGLESGRASAASFAIARVSGAASGTDERTYPIPVSDGVTIDRDAEVIVVRYQQHVYAFNLACPHENTALRWRAEDNRFQCPRHESKYQPDGTFISGRATRNMDRFAVKRTPAGLVVDLSRLYRSDQQNAEWTSASVAV